MDMNADRRTENRPPLRRLPDVSFLRIAIDTAWSPDGWPDSRVSIAYSIYANFILIFNLISKNKLKVEL